MRSNARPQVRTRSIGHDLGLDREDRLDPQRRADPRLRAADPAAAAQELERVDGEEDLELLARGAGARRRRLDPGAVLDRVGRGDRHQALAGADAGAVEHDDPLGRDAALDELVARLLGRAHGARDPAREVDREDVASPASISGS